MKGLADQSGSSRLAPSALVLLLLVGAGHGQWSRPPVDPAEYVSSSGRLRARIDPTDREGRGACRARVERDGRVLWERPLDFTLLEARLADDGTLVGYGIRGPRRSETFVVATLDPAGELLHLDETERVASRFLHTGPDPKPQGLFLDEDHDRFVVRVMDPDLNRGLQSWWTYRLSTGEPIGRVTPEEHLPAEGDRESRWEWDAAPVVGTELVLVHYDVRDSSAWPALGEHSLFTLVDSGGHAVWRHHVPDDHRSDHEEGEHNRWKRRVRELGQIQQTGSPGRFTLWFANLGVRVEFSVVRDEAAPEGWVVTELGRESHSPDLFPEPPEVPFAQLRPLGTVRLAARAPSSSAIRDVRELAVDPDGSLSFVRREGQDRVSVVGVSPDGEVLLEREFPLEGEGSRCWTYLGSHRWLMLFEGREDDDPTEAAILDGRSGDTTDLGELSCPGCPFADAVAALADGGFVALGRGTKDYNSGPRLRAFGADGSLLWATGSPFLSDDPTELLSPEDVAVVEGRIVVLDNIAQRLQVFEADGTFVRALELEEIVGRELNYPTGVGADGDSGVLVEDFRGDPTLWRLGLDGTVKASFTPRDPDGRNLRDVVVAPDGALWATDRHLLFRLDGAGSTTRVLGELPQEKALHQPGAVGFAPDGRIFVQDTRTANVHVFSPDGSPIQVLEAAAEDVDFASTIGEFTFGHDGDTYVSRNPSKGYLVFSGEGRVGTRDLGSREVAFVPGTDLRWRAASSGLELVDGAGTVPRTLERRPDGTWLRPSAVRIGGGRLLVSSVRGSGPGHQRSSFEIYSLDGEPIRSLELDRYFSSVQVAFQGEWLALTGFGPHGALVRVSDGRVFRLAVDDESEPRSTWRIGFSPDGSELWWLRKSDLVVHRFELPGD